SALGSGSTFGFSSLGSAGAGFNSAVAGGVATAASGAGFVVGELGVSERGAASFGAIGPEVLSTLTVFPAPPAFIPAAVMFTMTSLGVIGVGSTSGGSPTREALATSGCF